MQKMHIANSDKPIELYNLDVIISVGYRVKSQRGVEFRRWATQILKQYRLAILRILDHKLRQLHHRMVLLTDEHFLERKI